MAVIPCRSRMASRRGRVAGSIAHELAGETLYCLAALFGSMGCYRGNKRYRTSTLGGKHQIGTVTPSPQPVPPIMAGSWNMLLNAWDMAPKLKRQIVCPVSMPCTYGVPCSRRRVKQRKKRENAHSGASEALQCCTRTGTIERKPERTASSALQRVC